MGESKEFDEDQKQEIRDRIWASYGNGGIDALKETLTLSFHHNPEYVHNYINVVEEILERDDVKGKIRGVLTSYIRSAELKKI